MNRRRWLFVALGAGVFSMIAAMAAAISLRAGQYDDACLAVPVGTPWTDVKRAMEERGSVVWSSSSRGVTTSLYTFNRGIGLSRHQACRLTVDADGNSLSTSVERWTDFDRFDDATTYPRRHYLGAIARRIAP